MRNGTIRLGLWAALALGAAGPARAALIFSNYAGEGVSQAHSFLTLGTEFTVGPQDLILTRLGVYDPLGDGLITSHPVGVWRVSDEALIASATVPGGRSAPLVESWRFLGLGTPSLLTRNPPSPIAALETIPPDGIPVGGTFLTGPGIASTSPGSVLSSTFTPTLTYPAGSRPTTRVFANGDVTPAAVPEPSTLALAAMGGVG